MDVKAGIKSTEFWVSILGMGFSYLSLPPEQAAMLVTGIVAVYTAGRSVVKAVSAKFGK